MSCHDYSEDRKASHDKGLAHVKRLNTASSGFSRSSSNHFTHLFSVNAHNPQDITQLLLFIKLTSLTASVSMTSVS